MIFSSHRSLCRSLSLLFLISSICVKIAFSIWLTPGILEPPRANKILCLDERVEEDMRDPLASSNADPYMFCINEAIIKIQSATLILSNQNNCPLQYVNVPSDSLPNCPNNNFVNNDITTQFKSLCNTKKECRFSFTELPTLNCLKTSTDPYYSELKTQLEAMPDHFLAINVTYNCQLPRRRFRPFSNKRYNMKFTRTINHQLRHISYNRLMSL